MKEKKSKTITTNSVVQNTTEVADKFLLQEFTQSWGYQQHLESQMVNHLRFYVTILLALVSVSIAIFKYHTPAVYPIIGAIGVLFGVFWLVGLILRTAYLEIRIRKMKAIEDLNSIREYFAKKAPDISQYSTLPSHRDESPPFLRKGSAEWYSLIFMALVNSASFAAALYSTNYQWKWAYGLIDILHFPEWTHSAGWPLIVLIGIIMFIWEYRFFTLHCYKYDLKREKETGKPSKYTLLNLEDRALYERALIKLGELFEEGYLKKLAKQEYKEGSAHKDKGNV